MFNISNAKSTGNIYFVIDLSCDYNTDCKTGLGYITYGKASKLIKVINEENCVYSIERGAAHNSASGVIPKSEFESRIQNESDNITKGYCINSYDVSISSGTLNFSMNLTGYHAGITFSQYSIFTIFIELKV